MATNNAKMPSLWKSRSTGVERMNSSKTPMMLALPKIVEQKVSTDYSPSPGGGNKVHIGRNDSIQRATITPIVQKIKLDHSQENIAESTGNQKVYYNLKHGTKPKTQLGQDRWKTQQTRPSTSTWLNPECKLSLKISKIPTCHSKKFPRHIPSAKNYQNKGDHSLSATSKSVIPGKSEITDLCIGIQETWKVNSSETFKKSRQNSLHGNYMIGTKTAKQDSVPKITMNLSSLHSPLDISSFGNEGLRSRTSSRMGRNSLDQFLQNVKCKSDLACVKPKLISDKVVKRTETTQVVLSPMSSHKNQILHLKGFVRDPIHYHKSEGLSTFREETSTSANKTERIQATSRLSVRRRSLTPPFSSQKLLQHGDVPIPHSSNPLDGAYHIFKYIAS